MQPSEHGDIVPRPDPTRLTTEALHREIAHLREIHQFDMRASRELTSEQYRNTSLQINQLADTYRTAHTALVSVVDDNKLRITALEAVRLSGKDHNTSLYAALGILLTIVWIAITILALYHK